MGQVILYALGVLFCIASGVFLEHYLGPQPKLTNDEIFQCIDLIDDECRDDETDFRIAILRNELNCWLECPNLHAVTKELNEIIEKVKNKDYE